MFRNLAEIAAQLKRIAEAIVAQNVQLTRIADELQPPEPPPADPITGLAVTHEPPTNRP